MIILGIETSCDETGAAVVEKNSSGLHIISSEIASSLSLHAKTGGIIPETAAREQLRYILQIIKKATEATGWDAIDAIAVTYGPGLIGSLLVGVETAKTLSYVLKKPLIPVNHLYGHIYANWLSDMPYAKIQFPALALVVSGGHTDLVIMQSHEVVEVVGGTRDDAAGEAFDKIGRLLGLPYPAGATIAKLAENGDAKVFSLPRPLIGSDDFDFSFSGLKTAALREVQSNAILSEAKNLKEDPSAKHQNDKIIADFCASVQWSIVDVLVKKTIKAAKHYDVKSILLGGGVAANEALREQLMTKSQELGINFFVPTKNLCTDNGAMIAAAGFFAKQSSWETVTANPELYY